MRGVVYFIGDEHQGAVKIGHTSYRDAARRLKGLQGSNPSPLRILGQIPVCIVAEAYLHIAFYHQWMHHEWFRYTPEMEEFAAGLTGHSD